MAGDFRRRLPESQDFMAMLRNLSREEILDVLSEGLCPHCQDVVESRVHNFYHGRINEMSLSDGNFTKSSMQHMHVDSPDGVTSPKRRLNSYAPHTPNSWSSSRVAESTYAERMRRYVTVSSPSFANSKQPASNHSNFGISLKDGLSRSVVNNGLSEEQKEFIRFGQVGRRKDFVYYEKVDGKETNVLKGLELHTRVFNPDEQRNIVDLVYELQRMGQKGQLRARTYSEPRKWMRGKGRVTIQFGCCYNYAVDKDGNPPGIIRDEEVDPLPPLFKKMIRRMVRWHVLPPTCVPDSCIVNIYDEGDCIPPHIDHHDFVRPFCTVSFLSECNILFGTSLKIINPGEFAGPFSLPLPLGSVLILSGNGADIAKHCVPGVPSKRISITFRKMDERKLPFRYAPDPEFVAIKPLVSPSSVNEQYPRDGRRDKHEFVAENGDKGFSIEDDFPPLGGGNSFNHRSRR